MKNSLPRSAFAYGIAVGAMLHIAAAWVSAAAGTGSGTVAAAEAVQQLAPGDRLLVQAAAQLERRQSVSARLAHRVSMNGAELSGRGTYLQQGGGDDVRIRMELHIAGVEASLLQVSNSRFVWFDQRLPTGRTVTRIDLRQLRSDPVLSAIARGEGSVGEAGWSPGSPDLISQFGGLPRLLATLSDSFKLLPPQAMRLVSAQAAPETSVPFFAVVGHWKPEKLRALLEEQSVGDGSASAEKVVPGRVPLEVLLLFGQADLFPYRVEYRRLETPESSAGPPAAFQLSASPMVVLEFSDVVFDVPIAPGEFDYTPRDVNWVDHTATVLERLRQERQATVATRADTSHPAAPAR